MTELLVHWKEEYCIGVEEIDAQHKSLVDLINMLNADLNSGDANKFKAFQRAARRAVKYVQTHFASEEELMALHGYPELAHQKKRHAEFTKRILDDTSRFDRGDEHAPRSFLKYLSDWLLTHIAEEDAKIGIFLETKSNEAQQGTAVQNKADSGGG